MGLLLEDQDGVAGDAAAEAVRQAGHRVERHRGDRHGPADPGRITGDRVPQQVHIWIALGQDTLTDPGVDAHGPRRRRSAAGLDNSCPQQACRPQLCQRQEVVRAETETEQDLPGGSIHAQPCSRQHAQVFDRGCHAEGEVLGSGCPTVVIRRGADTHRSDVGVVFGRPGRQVGHLSQGCCRGHRQLAVACQHC